ncbi:MAG: hypothetical protein Rubg2KO_26990 [Rubricoccaceae bacterium]
MILTGPDRQPLPFGYRWAVANGLTSFTPWHILDSPDHVERISNEFSIETGVKCWAFSTRQDMDDAASFVIADGRVQDTVVSAHLSWKGARDSFARIEQYANFWEWLTHRALPDMAGWPDEADIKEAIERGGN